MGEERQRQDDFRFVILDFGLRGRREVLLARFWILRIVILKLFHISIFGFRILIQVALGAINSFEVVLLKISKERIYKGRTVWTLNVPGCLCRDTGSA